MTPCRSLKLGANERIHPVAVQYRKNVWNGNRFWNKSHTYTACEQRPNMHSKTDELHDPWQRTAQPAWAPAALQASGLQKHADWPLACSLHSLHHVMFGWWKPSIMIQTITRRSLAGMPSLFQYGKRCVWHVHACRNQILSILPLCHWHGMFIIYIYIYTCEYFM